MGRDRHIREKIEKIIGRKLTSDEEIHHRDRNPNNNGMINFQILTKEGHKILRCKGKDAYYKYLKKKELEKEQKNEAKIPY